MIREENIFFDAATSFTNKRSNFAKFLDILFCFWYIGNVLLIWLYFSFFYAFHFSTHVLQLLFYHARQPLFFFSLSAFSNSVHIVFFEFGLIFFRTFMYFSKFVKPFYFL